MLKIYIYICIKYISGGHVGRFYINVPNVSNDHMTTLHNNATLIQYTSDMRMDNIDTNEFIEPINDMNIKLAEKFYGNNLDRAFKKCAELYKEG